MEYFIASIVTFALAALGLGVGVLAGRAPRRSCGQVGADAGCDACTCREKDHA